MSFCFDVCFTGTYCTLLHVLPYSPSPKIIISIHVLDLHVPVHTCVHVFDTVHVHVCVLV